MMKIPIKARLIIKSFEQFKKEINLINNYKNKFESFKVKLDFQKEPELAKKENKKLEQILNEGIEKVSDSEVRKLLKEALK